MKKMILVSILALGAVTCMAQAGRQQQVQVDTVVRFEAPYKFYNDAFLHDTATVLGISVDDNLKKGFFTWYITSSKNKILRSGTYICAGNCYAFWKEDRTAINAAQIVADSVIKRALVE